LYGDEKGDANGEVIVDAAGELKEAGRVGTEGGVVEEEGPVVVVFGADGAGEDVLGAGADVDAAAAAAMEPLRSHGFGGEPIVRIGRRECSLWMVR
jgi:hypothetical protein